jgi:hypothetical protein
VKRLKRIVWTVLFSQATPPFVIGFFLLVYVGIAFITDETLIALMGYTRTSFFLTAMLALLPLNFAVRMVAEAIGYWKMRRSVTVGTEDVSPELFDETAGLAVSSSFEQLQSHLETLGYKTRCTAGALGAWRGISVFPARMSFVVGVFCLFAGIFISLTSRSSERVVIVEGENFSSSAGESGIVERIALKPSSGLILAKKLSMEVASSSGKGKDVFGVYPPSLYQGAFVYPRYLGIGLFLAFSAPDLPTSYETFTPLNIYPPGREATSVIPGSAYRLVFSLAEANDETDPYTTGRMNFNFKLLKGKDLVLTGSVPSGDVFVRDGYRLAIPDSRRVVITDFIRDYGVLLIWASGILIVAAGCFWLPVRVFFPRSEMLFRSGPDQIQAFSLAEGRRRKHEGIFHEALDLLEMRGRDRKAFEG